MSVLVFGNYLQTGGEGEPFEPGSLPTLDCIGGFVDAQIFFEPQTTAETSLFFLVSDQELWSASESAFENPLGFRERLDSSPLVTGTVVETGVTTVRFRVERLRLFRDVYEAKKTDSNEALEQVGRYDELWASVHRGLRQLGDEYRYSVGRQLPPVSAVRDAAQEGLAATKRLWETTMLLEARQEGQVVRVVAYGDNHEGEACQIFDITDVEEYRAAVEERAAGARLKTEARFWGSLLD